MNIDNSLLVLVEQDAQEQKGIEFDAIRDAWINAGKPTSAADIKNILKQVGLSDEQITQTFDAAGYTSPDNGATQEQPNAPADKQQPNAAAANLDPKRKKGLDNLISVASKEQLTQIYNAIEQQQTQAPTQ